MTSNTTNTTFEISALSESIGESGLKCLKITPLASTTPEVVREGLIYDMIQYLSLLQETTSSGHTAPNVALLCMSDIVGSIKRYFKPIDVNLSVYCKTDNLVRRALYIPAQKTPTTWPNYSSASAYETSYMADLVQAAVNDGNTVFIPCFTSTSQIAPDLFSMKKDFGAVFRAEGLVPYALFSDHFCFKFEEQLPQNETLFSTTVASPHSSLKTLFSELTTSRDEQSPIESGRIKFIKIRNGPSTTRTNRILETLFGPSNVVKKEVYNVTWITDKTHILLAKVLKGNASIRVGGKDYTKLELTITKGSSEIEVLVWETNGQEIGSNFEGDKYKNPLLKPHVTFNAVNKDDDYEVVKLGLDSAPLNIPSVTNEDVSKYEELFEKVISLRNEREWSEWKTTIKGIWEEKGVLYFAKDGSAVIRTMEEALNNIVLTIPFRTHRKSSFRSEGDLSPPGLTRSLGGHRNPVLSRATSQVELN